MKCRGGCVTPILYILKFKLFHFVKPPSDTLLYLKILPSTITVVLLYIDLIKF